MTLFIFKFIMLSVCLKLTNGHGFLLNPLARQRFCYLQQDYYWPPDGSKIKDTACRAAYQHVFKKENSSAAAQYMFNQYAEYSALAGRDYENIEYIQNQVVSHTLCGAGSNNQSGLLGDKSGIDLNLENWHTTNLHNWGLIDLYFCPTAIHTPSYFEIYITNPTYDYKEPVHWSNINLIYRDTARLVPNTQETKCDNGFIYSMNVDLPPRNKKFVLYTRWQREDYAGEGFYNCADVEYIKKEEL